MVDILPARRPKKLSVLIEADAKTFREAELMALFLENREWKHEELENAVAFLLAKEKISSNYPFLLRFFENKLGQETIGECSRITPFLALVKRDGINRITPPEVIKDKVEEYSENIKKNKGVALAMRKIAEENFLVLLGENKWALREVDDFYRANHKEIDDSPLLEPFFSKCNSIYSPHLAAWVEKKNKEKSENAQ